MFAKPSTWIKSGRSIDSAANQSVTAASPTGMITQRRSRTASSASERRLERVRPPDGEQAAEHEQVNVPGPRHVRGERSGAGHRDEADQHLNDDAHDDLDPGEERDPLLE